MNVAMSIAIDRPFDEVLGLLPEALKGEGFGILTEIDVQKTLREKLDVDGPRYRILGSCNPQLAHRALQVEPDAGVLLPCNVIVREETPRRTVVAAVDPMGTVGSAAAAGMREVAVEVRAKLARVLEAVMERSKVLPGA